MIKQALLLAGLPLWLGHAQTAFTTFVVNQAVPDGDPSGLVDKQTLTGLGTIEQLSVELAISGTGGGAFNGDLYVTLYHPASGNFAVLLNRPGRDSTSPFGYGDNGFRVTLNDGIGAHDIHAYREILQPASGYPLTGLWAADNRNVDPDLVLSSTVSPSTSLGSFTGADANGEWILFAADVSGGGTAQLDYWGLSFETVLIPEPAGAPIPLAFGVLVCVVLRLRRASDRAP